MATTSQYPVKTISHLFWNKYSHKIVVNMDSYAPAWGAKSAFSPRIVEEAHVLRYCPETDTSWKYTSNSDTVVLFFMNKTDFDHAVAKLGSKIREVWQPVSNEQTKLLSEDHKVITRDKLFFGKFNWCVTYRRVDRYTRSDIRTSIADVFDVDDEAMINDRIHFSDGDHIRVYLCSEADVVMLKMMQSERIRKIEQVVLTETLTPETK